MSAAIYYHPEAYSINGPKLMGRQVAGASFLRGLLRYGRTEVFWAQVEQQEHGLLFAQAVQAAGRSEVVKILDKHGLFMLTEPGTLYYPGPDLAQRAWQRAAYGHAAWSLCGVTHTTSSSVAMDAVAELLSAPLQPWDAVICTSTKVKDNVQRLLEAQFDYLVHRFDLKRASFPRLSPQLPVIPLGIHTDDFVFSVAQRQRARQQLALDASSLVVLYMGRLSFHAKAHPLAMYQALEKAARSLPTGSKVVLLECGWHFNDAIASAFKEAAHLACPGVQVLMLDGRKLDERTLAWASADVFCSLSDNIQETFGIVPIEAMAAGLPLVVSDWDGYQDSVRDGVDGYRIPTLMPAVGLGGDLALRHALDIDSYDVYCGNVCALVAVDVEATAKAFTRLFASAQLRRQMGAAGRQHARTVYDWAVIMPQYEALWQQLGMLRKSHAPSLTPLQQPWPARMDPFHAFASYPTHTLAPHMMMQLADADVASALARLAAYRQLAMVRFADLILPTKDEAQLVLTAAAGAPKSALTLLNAIPSGRKALVFRALAALLKFGILKLCR